MIKLLILDVDGVMTDGRKYYDKEGNVKLKTFCDKDWTAIKRFKALGIKVILLTGDPFNVVIGENRKLDVIVNRFSGEHRDKSSYLPGICEDYEVTPKEICFIGDDIFDIGLLKLVGHPYCPKDSAREVRNVAKILGVNGGDNVVMHLFDSLRDSQIIPRISFDEHLQDVYDLDILEKF